jgi:lipoate-protein ligase A
MAFIDALNSLAVARDPAWTLLCRDRDSDLTASEEPFLCFQRRAFGDVLLVPEHEVDEMAEGVPGSSRGSPRVPPMDIKILGSAQRRLHGAILQHGSLLLEKSPYAPELTGWYDHLAARIPVERLTAAVSERLSKRFECPLSDAEFPQQLDSKAEQVANEKYGSLKWTNRRQAADDGGPKYKIERLSYAWANSHR